MSISPGTLACMRNAISYWLVPYLTGRAVNLHRYPDGSCYYLNRAVADHLGVAPEQLVFGNGSNEIIEFLVKAFVKEEDEVITSHPSFLMYQKFVQVRGGRNHVVELKDMHHDLDAIGALVSPATKLIFIDNPNNPMFYVVNFNKAEREVLGAFLERHHDFDKQWRGEFGIRYNRVTTDAGEVDGTPANMGMAMNPGMPMAMVPPGQQLRDDFNSANRLLSKHHRLS